MSLRAAVARFALRRPRAAIALSALGLAGVIAMGASARCRARCAANIEDLPGRAILGRAWFDELPSSRTSNTKLFIWFGGGIGIYEEGSSFKFTVELFEFERTGNKIDMTFFQDKARVETRFRVEPCDEKPPFDACLRLDASPRGPATFYGFLDDGDLADHVPWAPAHKAAAERFAASVGRSSRR